MTAPLVTHRRPWVPLVNMLVAVAALVIALIALAFAPADTVLIPPTPAAAVVAEARPGTRRPASHRRMRPNQGLPPMLNPTTFDAVVADHRRDLEAQARTARLASHAPKAARRGARPWLTSAIRLLARRSSRLRHCFAVVRRPFGVRADGHPRRSDGEGSGTLTGAVPELLASPSGTPRPRNSAAIKLET